MEPSGLIALGSGAPSWYATDELLQERGLIVKNTFIGSISPLCSLVPRSASAPPRSGSRSCDEQFFCAGGIQQVPKKDTDHAPTSCRSHIDVPTSTEGGIDPRSTLQKASSQEVTSSMQTSADRLSGIEGSDTEQTPAFVNMIKQECGFLCIHRFVLHERRKPNRHGRGREVVEPCLRVIVRGLPLVKRSRWLLPMSFMVATILQRRGCTCHVKKDSLYVQCPDGDSMRVEFSPVRNRP